MIMIMNMNKVSNVQTYCCDICNFSTTNKGNYNIHMSTKKHKKLIEVGITCIETISDNNIFYKCALCHKCYKSRSGLWKHQQTCNKNECTLITKETFNELIHDNNDLKSMVHQLHTQLIEQSKSINSIVNNITNNTLINNSNSFNLNIFLNETCKDAMNLDDFVSSIKVTLEDLERTGEKGYIEGISKIFINNLNIIEDRYRPLHCSDAKREVFYIKHNNEWIKEKENKPLLIGAIKKIAHENVKKIKEWTEKYPDCIKPTSKKNDAYLKILSNSMNGSTDEESINNIYKVISIIGNEVVINKVSTLKKN
jgi:Zinc-finger of C2H2 type/Zinc finger, C2H2 type